MPQTSIFWAAILAYGCWIALQDAPPVLQGTGIDPWSGLLSGILIIACLAMIGEGFSLLGTVFDWLRAVKPTFLKGSAGWITSLRQLGRDYKRTGWGPYWGYHKSWIFGRARELISPYESIAVSVGTTGSGKSSGAVVTNALSIPNSKCILDFKGSLTCMLADTLRKRGEQVRVLNFANAYTDIIGPSDAYNPTAIITDCFKRPGGLLEVAEILEEMSYQIFPEPKASGGTTDNAYFRNGSRSLIRFAILTCVLVDGEKATLGDALMMLNDRESLLKHALWACGRLPVEPQKITKTHHATPASVH